MNKNDKAGKENFVNILNESLRFHGLLTKAQDQNPKLTLKQSGELPDHLQTADFLLKKKAKTKDESLPTMKIAALKKRK